MKNQASFFLWKHLRRPVNAGLSVFSWFFPHKKSGESDKIPSWALPPLACALLCLLLSAPALPAADAEQAASSDDKQQAAAQSASSATDSADTAGKKRRTWRYKRKKKDQTTDQDARPDEMKRSDGTIEPGAAKRAEKKKKKPKVLKIEVKVEGKLEGAAKDNVRNFISFSRLDPTEVPSEGMFSYYLDKAGKEARTALEPFGYYNPTIDVKGERTDKAATVTISVKPGEATKIRNVEVNYAGEGKEEAPLLKARDRLLGTKDDTFIHGLYEQSKGELLDLAVELGYPLAHYTRNRVEVRRSENSAGIFLDLDTARRHTISALNFNAEHLDHDFLRRVVSVKAGDPLSPSALTTMRQALYDSGYFESVDVQYDLDKAEDAKVPLDILTTPSARHHHSFGIGYGTDTGMRGTIGYSNRYLNRWGHQLDIMLRPSEQLSTFSAQYAIPVGELNKDKLYISTSYQKESFQNIDSLIWLSKISREHNWKNGNIAVYLQYLDEDYDTGMKGGHARMLIPGISGTLFYADNRINTKHGVKFWGSLEGSDQHVTGNTSFIQLKGGAKAIVTPFENWRLIGTGQVGVTWADDLADLPPSLRFFAGGDRSVRGYGYKRIAPHDIKDNLIGGRNLLGYSVEIERILFAGLALAAFWDSAAVMNDFNEYKMVSGMGVGIHWNGPFGQVRFDLAVPEDDPSLKTTRIHFSLGTDL